MGVVAAHMRADNLLHRYPHPLAVAQADAVFAATHRSVDHSPPVEAAGAGEESPAAAEAAMNGVEPPAAAAEQCHLPEAGAAPQPAAAAERQQQEADGSAPPPPAKRMRHGSPAAAWFSRPIQGAHRQQGSNPQQQAPAWFRQAAAAAGTQAGRQQGLGPQQQPQQRAQQGAAAAGAQAGRQANPPSWFHVTPAPTQAPALPQWMHQGPRLPAWMQPAPLAAGDGDVTSGSADSEPQVRPRSKPCTKLHQGTHRSTCVPCVSLECYYLGAHLYPTHETIRRAPVRGCPAVFPLPCLIHRIGFFTTPPQPSKRRCT